MSVVYKRVKPRPPLRFRITSCFFLRLHLIFLFLLLLFLLPSLHLIFRAFFLSLRSFLHHQHNGFGKCINLAYI